jgi:hypothetical protein
MLQAPRQRALPGVGPRHALPGQRSQTSRVLCRKAARLPRASAPREATPRPARSSWTVSAAYSPSACAGGWHSNGRRGYGLPCDVAIGARSRSTFRCRPRSVVGSGTSLNDRCAFGASRVHGSDARIRIRPPARRAVPGVEGAATTRKEQLGLARNLPWRRSQERRPGSIGASESFCRCRRDWGLRATQSVCRPRRGPHGHLGARRSVE